MDERLAQALIRLVVIFLTAGVTALGANFTILQEAINDPVFASLVFAVGTAILSAILKWLGGITQEPVSTDGVRAADRRGVKRPNALAL